MEVLILKNKSFDRSYMAFYLLLTAIVYGGIVVGRTVFLERNAAIAGFNELLGLAVETKRIKKACVLMCFVCIMETFIRENNTFDRSYKAFYIIFTAVIWYGIILCNTMFWERNALVACYNALLELAAEARKSATFTRNDLEIRASLWYISDKFGFCVFIPALAGAMGVTLSVIIAIFFDTDGTYFLLEYILPDPIFRSQTTILWSLAFRFAFTLNFAKELTRSGIFTLAVLNIGIDSSSQIIKNLMVINDMNSPTFHTQYIRFMLVYKKGERLLNQMLHGCIMITFWTLVTCLWISVKGYGKAQPHIFWCSISCGMFLIMAHVLLLPLLIEMVEQLASLVPKHQLKVRFERAWCVPGEYRVSPEKNYNPGISWNFVIGRGKGGDGVEGESNNTFLHAGRREVVMEVELVVPKLRIKKVNCLPHSATRSSKLSRNTSVRPHRVDNSESRSSLVRIIEHIAMLIQILLDC
ncbi:unnamed protein product [Orchesella dallaii]|uniref:Gustatory receptor n=1 Tax=Orchesella dallaii TaxID=48710 RepID=A0ABP1PIK0_9HEXA